MDRIARRHVIAGSAAVVLASSVGRLSAATPDWPTTTPAEAGFAPDLDARLDKLIADKRAWELHGVVIVRGGKLVLERYFEGADEVWGPPSRHVVFGRDTLHDLRSATKSIVGLLYGIALAQGKVPAPDQPLMASFPEYADLATDPPHKRLTVAHALTMTLGIEWNEDVPYEDPANSEVLMETAPDRYRYILSRPIVAEPGTRWTYSGGATALLGKIIVNGTGKPLEDFARAALFEPLGIGKTEWTKGFNGEASAASGLRMTPRDLARIGQLALNRGQWDGRQIVPAAWLEKSLQPVGRVDEFRRYGYHWYMGEFGYGDPPGSRKAHWIGAFGYGGQRLFVLPSLDLAVAITAGNYTDPDQWIPPIRMMREVILPNIR